LIGDFSNFSGAEQYTIDAGLLTATGIFIISYVVIISEKLHKTIVALFGAAIMIVVKIVTQHEAFHVEEFGVDWNVIFLLISMMIIINLMKPTGFFEYIAIKSVKIGKGDPLRIMIIFAIITAFLSALLDNVTTVLLMVPVTLLITDALEIDAVPFLITEVLASNIGGTATLIGDPPNILIASKAKLTFVDFIYHLMPIVIVLMVVLISLIYFLFRKKIKTEERLKERVMRMNEADSIKDPVILRKALLVLAIVMTGFVFHGTLHFEPATVAFFGAALLFAATAPSEPNKIFADIDWSTIFFFIGLFIIIGGITKVGLIQWLSIKVLDMTQGSLFATSMIVMWFSAVASAFVDNIPYVAIMNTLVVDMTKNLWPGETGVELLQNHDLMPVWWSLALGACLGGNGSPIGASANVVVIGMSEKAGKGISFMRFIAYGVPVMIITVALSMVYIWIRYYLLNI
jgi:Na+/H+ antiporter NhaD/arsenite permease-like protein